MTTDPTGSGGHPFGRIAEEFAERLRRGEHPSLTEYAARYPELADEIRDLLPALVAMEELGPGGDDRTGAYRASVGRDSALPDRLGDYLILREVGRGGMGVVYEAEQESLVRHVALKVLPRHALLDPQTLARFRREARAAARLHHSNIVPVFGVGEEQGLHYYVMQYIHGRGLDQVIRELRQLGREGSPAPPAGVAARWACGVSAADVAAALATGHFSQLPASGDRSKPVAATLTSTEAVDLGSGVRVGSVREINAASSPGRSGHAGISSGSAPSRPYWEGVARVVVQVARALQYAHGQGVLHRDIKPSNLLLDIQGTIWVTDFGLAKAIDEADLTHTGDVVGTLRYMAPERFRGQADARSDLYALGLTLYELLTLRPGFDATDRDQLIEQVAHTEPPRPRKVVPAIPRDLETICLKCIEKQPVRRYGSAELLAEDLERWLDGLPIAARRVSALERAVKWARRQPALAGLIGLSIGSLVGGLILVSWYNVQLSAALADARHQQERAERSAYIADLNLVRHALGSGDVAAVLDKLQTLGPAGRRGFEWHYLRRQCEYELRGRWETGEPVQCLTFTPDGRRIASGHGYSMNGGADDRPGVVQVRDPEGGRLLLRFEAHRGPVLALAFSRDGRTLATAGVDRTAKVWDAATGRLLYTLGGHPAEVNGVAFSTDGRWIATASGRRYEQVVGSVLRAESPGEVALWDAATGREVWRASERGGAARNVLFDPRDGSRLASGSFLSLSIRDLATGRVLREVTGQIGFPLDFSADGRWLGVCGEGAGRLWDTASDFTVHREINSPTNILATTAVAGSRRVRHGYFSDIAFQPPGADYIAVVRGGIPPEMPEFARIPARLKLVYIEDSSRNVILYALAAHTAAVRDLAYRRDGRRLATADAAGVVALWEPFGTKPAAESHASPCGVRSAALRPDGRQLALAGDDGVVRLDALDPPGPRTQRAGHHLAVLALAYSPDGRALASAGEDGRILVGPPGGPAHVLAGHHGPVHGLAYRPDGRQLASAGSDGGVRLWDTAGGTPARVLAGHTGVVLGMAYSPDGRRLASVGSDGDIRLWDTDAGVPVRSWPAGCGVLSAVTFVGPGGRRLATAGADQAVRLWEVADGRPSLVLRGHTGDVLALASGGVGQPRLVSAGKDHTLRIWDVETGQEILALHGHADDVTALSFSGDGRRLATAGADRTALVWEAGPAPFVEPAGPGWTVTSDHRDR